MTSERCIICIMYRARYAKRITYTTLLHDKLASEKLLSFNMSEPLKKKSVLSHGRYGEIFLRIYFIHIYFCFEFILQISLSRM